MKKIVSMFILCFVISCVCVCGVNAVKVDIPFDYNASPVFVYAKSSNDNVSVEVCQGGIIRTTSLSDDQIKIIKHVCYEDIYWIEYIDNQFIAFSSNYMLTSSDGYNWNAVEDKCSTNINRETFHEIYGVDANYSAKRLYSINIEPDFKVTEKKYKREDGLNIGEKIVYTGLEWFKYEDTFFSAVESNYDDNGVLRSVGDFDRKIYRSNDGDNWEYIETRESNYKI